MQITLSLLRPWETKSFSILTPQKKQTPDGDLPLTLWEFNVSARFRCQFVVCDCFTAAAPTAAAT